MSVLNVTLREGCNSVEVLPYGDGTAVVLGGNVHHVNDRVLCPDQEMTWQDAAEPKEGGDTHVSPFDLQLVEDPGLSVLASFGCSIADISEAMEDMEDDGARLPFMAADLAVDDSAAYARLLSQAIRAPELKSKKSLRRRSTDRRTAAA